MDQVTTISFFLVLMVWALPLIAKWMRRHPRKLMFGKVCILGVYLFVNLYLTLLSRKPKANYTAALVPFWSYAASLQGNTGLAIQVILNILLYIPLGYLLHFTFPNMKPLEVIAIGCIASICTEGLQLVLKLGLCEFDDVFNNTLGTIIGVGSYWGIRKFIK